MRMLVALLGLLPLVTSQAAPPAAAPSQHATLRLAIEDLARAFGGRYSRAPEFLARLQALEKTPDAAALEDLRREALLANPLLDFDRLLVIERGEKQMGLPTNWQGNSSLPRKGYDNQVVLLSNLRANVAAETLYRPQAGQFVGDLSLHPDGNRLLLSMPDDKGRFQVFEMNLGDRSLHQITSGDDFDNYDACYLPSGKIIFCSTANMQGVPCVWGSDHVGLLYVCDPDGKNVRQLTFDQDHSWSPRVMNDGRILYQRWEYADLPHSNSRRLFVMNPDGTEQMAYYGSNSYFPNSFFYARPIPGHATKVVGIATGHHGNRRTGRLLILDPSLGRKEADGVVQEIPGYGKKVEPLIRDQLANGVWPQFLHPWPLSEKYFLVSMKPSAKAKWGIYLVDVFDNMVLIKEADGANAILEPMPLVARSAPPVVPDRVKPERKDATVYLANVYHGPGLKGVPRGTVKQLRVIAYHFGYRGVGGLLGSIGMDGPWDIRRVLGTVPVEEDGSAHFAIPANTPVTVQPLDGEGKAMQLMRSWFVGMPGEVVSCAGCHDSHAASPPPIKAMALRHKPDEIKPWYGPTRGFSFAREVQPVIDRHCVSCHDGSKADVADLRGTETIKDWNSKIAGKVHAPYGGKFSVAYANLHAYVRRPGIESDIHMLAPMEYHADTTELVQLLMKGHYGVKLDGESWDRLVTWIDLNTPFHGTWTEIAGAERVSKVAARTAELSKQFANVDENRETLVTVAAAISGPVPPAPEACVECKPVVVPGWPMDLAEAKKRQAALGETSRSFLLAEGVSLELIKVPAGRFAMGDVREAMIDKPFWMARIETTNQQFAVFDPLHDSHVESKHGYQFGIHGVPMDKPKQPAVRLNWNRAAAFCEWLSAKTGRKFALPTEEQWEWACRAGSATAFSFGDANADFSKHANFADAKLKEFVVDPYTDDKVLPNLNRYDDWIPKDARFDDGGLVTRDAASYAPNAWGLFDMHGNAAEWTRSEDGKKKVVKGGSWYDRPFRGQSSARRLYPSYQGVFDVGFRVVCEED